MHLGSYPAPTFMHAPENVRVGSLVIVPPDEGPAARELVSRIVAAYRRARRELRVPDRSMWDDIAARNADFCGALHAGDEDAVFAALRGMFQSRLIWGLGFVEEQVTRTDHDRDHYLRLLTDALRSLGESVGRLPMTCIEQEGTDVWLHALDFDLDELVRSLASHRVDVAFPEIGGAYGSRLDGRFVTVDSIVQSAVVWRLRQVGAGPSSRIIEIGGGYGCLALKAFEAGLAVHIYDLPWVNAVQGYFLGLAAGPERVSLFGEPPAEIRVLPYWTLDLVPARSVDFAVSANALAEMGHEAAFDHVRQIDRVLRGSFLSIGQEAQVRYRDVGAQNRVLSLARRSERLRLISRQPWWMRQGYVEEVYAPAPRTLTTAIVDIRSRLGRRPRALAARAYHSRLGTRLLRPSPPIAARAAVGHSRDLASLRPRIQPLHVRIGDETSVEQELHAAPSARHHCRCAAGDRIDVDLGVRVDAAYQLSGDSLVPLPPAASCDRTTGRFVWRTPISLLGTCHFVFPSADERVDLIVAVADPTDARDVAVHLDTPTPGATVAGSFVMAGWAVDPLAQTGTGVIDLAVTIRRADGDGGHHFSGVAVTGGRRPDVAAAFGDQFESAGFTLTVPPLPSGTYDISVRPRTRRRTVAPESMVRISAIPSNARSD
jgi:hypothetical protein